MQFLGESQLYKKLCRIDGNLLHTYLEHDKEVFITDSIRRIIYNIGVYLEVDIRGFDIILGRL